MTREFLFVAGAMSYLTSNIMLAMSGAKTEEDAFSWLSQKPLWWLETIRAFQWSGLFFITAAALPMGW